MTDPDQEQTLLGVLDDALRPYLSNDHRRQFVAARVAPQLTSVFLNMLDAALEPHR